MNQRVNVLSRPWLHFIALGLGLFLLKGQLFPEPKPSLGPLPPAQVNGLERQWFATTGRMPNEAQLDAMVRAELDRKMLFREALALDLHRIDPIVQQRLVRNMRFLKLDRGRDDAALIQDALRMELHLGDEVVKRRLVQVMEQLLLSRRPPGPVTEAEIAAAFSEQRDELVEPARYTLQQVFLARERADDAEALLARFREEGLSPEVALQFSSPFLPGYRFVGMSAAQLARQFGAAFVLNLRNARPQTGQWVGPVQSTYGAHLVWLEALQPERPLELDEVSEQLRRDIEHSKRQQALAEAVAAVREDYEVIL